MKTITNISNVSETSGETPISTPSNAVTTVIKDTDPICFVSYCFVPCCPDCRRSDCRGRNNCDEC